MKHVFARTLTLFTAILLLASIAAAKSPTLEPIHGDRWPTEVRPGQALSFSCTYTGDPPTSLTMVVLTPNGETVHVPAKASVGDASTGVAVTWPYTPTEAGTYHYHFEASAGDLGAVQYPTVTQGDLDFVSTSLVTKYIIFAVGTLIALFFVPFVVYVLARAVNKRGSPASAARIALLIGILASYGLFLYLFFHTYSLLENALAGLAALALLIVLFTRK